MATRYIATVEGEEHELEVEELAASSIRLKIGKSEFEADVRRVSDSSYSILVNNRSFDFEVMAEGDELIVASRRGSSRVTLADAVRHSPRGGSARPEVAGRAEVKAMMPGRVVNVLVAAGETVALGQGLIVIEAMKMENELKSPKAGVVAEVKVAAGQTVEKGGVLIVIE
jgi:biotin carboxyl carrier protein